MKDEDYDSFEPTYPLSRDTKFIAWVDDLRTLPVSVVSIRQAKATAEDARRVKDLQALCPPITVRAVRDNALTIADRLVLLADVSGTHVGFCVARPGVRASDPIFVQVVAVAPDAQRRGIGLALLTAAAERWPQRNLVFATQDDNSEARAMNEKFARVIGAEIRRINLRTYPDRYLGIQRGWGYRAWMIVRGTNGTAC